jgi:PadR family transcriptional regulator PadR
MLLPVNAAMLEACVLAVAAREDTYGYKLTQELTEKTGISESALYPVLRRLQKDGALSTYDVNISGRNRRYYKVTQIGEKLLTTYQSEWTAYKDTIDSLLQGAETPIQQQHGGDAQ